MCSLCPSSLTTNIDSLSGYDTSNGDEDSDSSDEEELDYIERDGDIVEVDFVDEDESH